LKESDIVLRNGFDELISLPGWGNGRDVNQIWEDVKLHRSNRVVNENEITKTITINDIDLAMEKMISNRKKPISKSSIFNTPNENEPKMLQELLNNKETNIQNQKSTTNELNESDNGENGVSSERESDRDEGVSEEIWQELEKAKQKEKEEKERLEEIKRQLEEAERLKDEKKKAELLEELKRRQEEERRREVMKKQLLAIQNCPMGFSWYEVGGGWRCCGGSHFCSNEQLRTQFGYEYN